MSMDGIVNIIDSVQNAVTAMEDGMNKFNAVQSLILGEKMSDSSIKSLQEFPCIQEYLDLPMNDPQESDLKKVFAGAISAANDLGILPFELEDSSAETIAAIADDSLQRMKITYKIATGLFNVEEAADAMVDHLAARAVAFADYAVDSAANWTANAITTAIATVYPPAAIVAPVIHAGMSYVGEKVKTVIHEYAPKITSFAKEIVHDSISLVKDVATSFVSNVSSSICSLGSSIFSSIFG